MTLIASLLVDCRCALAEGIQWHDETRRLYWTDILEKRLWSCDADGGAVTVLDLPERLGAFAFDPDGAILAGFESGLFRMSPNGDRLDRLTEFEPTLSTTRLNDGRCDRQGRFLIGGVDEDGQKPITSLIRYGAGASETLRDGIRCSNGLAFSPDGRTLYFADSPTRRMVRYDYDPDTGTIGEEQLVATVPESDGVPDGSCVDRQGNLWNARFFGGHVQEYRPDGTPGRRITVPVPKVTCACFGGPDLDRLYISTAQEFMSEAELAAAPTSGSIFVIAPGATGLPEERYAERLFADPAMLDPLSDRARQN